MIASIGHTVLDFIIKQLLGLKIFDGKILIDIFIL